MLHAEEPAAASRSSRSAPQLDCGRWPREAVARRQVEVWADIFRDGHESCARRSSTRPGRRRRSGAARHGTPRRRPLDGSFEPIEARPLAVHGRGVGRPLRLVAPRGRAQGRRGPGGPRRRARRGRGACSASESPDASRRRSPGAPRSTARARSEATASPRPDARGRRRPRAGALRRLVRALPALVGRLRRRRGGAPAARGARLRRRLPPADPPDRRDEPQGRNNALDARPDDPGSPWAIGGEEGGHTGGHPELGTLDDFARLVARGRELGVEICARLRDPVLARPPVAEGAPRVVPPPPRRDAQVRREPAQEVPGHLQRQLRLRGLGRGSGRRSTTSSCFWVDRA